MQLLLSRELRFIAEAPHVWWGVSVENKKHGLPRVRQIQSAHVSMRFLSIEPLLEDLGNFDLEGIHWVIVGGESGRGARPLRREWVVRVLKQCREASVPFFFKQWGGVRKKEAGRMLNGRFYDELPEIEVAPAPERSSRAALLAAASELAERFMAKPLLQLA